MSHYCCGYSMLPLDIWNDLWLVYEYNQTVLHTIFAYSPSYHICIWADTYFSMGWNVDKCWEYSLLSGNESAYKSLICWRHNFTWDWSASIQKSYTSYPYDTLWHSTTSIWHSYPYDTLIHMTLYDNHVRVVIVNNYMHWHFNDIINKDEIRSGSGK